jgi:hypothetical protein
MRRGWVQQERLLAPRILYFGRGQLFWECRDYNACESFPNGLSSLYMIFSYSFIKLWDIANPTLGTPHEDAPGSLWLHF